MQAHVRARQGGIHAIDLTNTHIVTLRRQDPHFRKITSQFDYFVPDGMPLIRCLNEIDRLSPNFIWVGLGTPKQQKWIDRHKSAIAHGCFSRLGLPSTSMPG